MAYLGNSPGVASQRVVTTFTATAGQTVFTPQSGYTLGYCDVFLNGIKLVNGDDYTASNGTSITLASGAAAGDSVEVVAYFPRGLSDGYLKSEADAKYVAKTGGTMTGALRVSGSAATNNAEIQITNSDASGGNWRIGDNIGSAAGKLTIYDAKNGIASFMLDGAGRVTMPYQPSAAVSTTQTGIGTIVGGTVDYDTTGMYNSSTGGFTVPVSGRYLVGLSCYTNGTNQMELFLRVNGAAVRYLNNITQNMLAWGQSPATIIKCAANDVITFTNGKGEIRGGGTEFRYVHLLG